MKKYYERIIKDSEKRAEILLDCQILDENSFDFGGVKVSSEYVEAKPTIYKIASSIAVFLNEKSKFYGDELLLQRISLALDYVRKMQREDGTFDLKNCNFYSAPDTAFCLKRLVPSYRLLEKANNFKNCDILKNKIYTIIADGARGLAYGGFHTPNHRWAIASILYQCYSITKEKELLEKAEQYLREGIDCNEDGEYTERSAAIYNLINNACMVTIYEETKNEKYLKYVNKNLEMMLTYFEPDGSIFTGNSTRQDNGKKAYPRDYFYYYLYFAEKYNNKIFEAAAHKIIEDNITKGYKKLPDCLDLLMLHPNLLKYELCEEGFPIEYSKYYESSGIVRAKKGNISYSILKNSNKFLFFQKNELDIYMKIGISFFDQRAYKIQNLEKVDNGYCLKYNAKSWYYLPFKDVPNTNDWWQMDNQKREKLYKKDLNIVVNVTEVENGIDVNIETTGCDRVPIKIEIGVPGHSTVESDSFYVKGTPGDALILRKGVATVTNNMDKITIGPGFGTHQFIDGKNDSDQSEKDSFTLYLTDDTNFNHTIEIRSVR